MHVKLTMWIYLCVLAICTVVNANGAVRQFSDSASGQQSDTLTSSDRLTSDQVIRRVELWLAEQQAEIADLKLELSELKSGNDVMKMKLAKQDIDIEHLQATILNADSKTQSTSKLPTKSFDKHGRLQKEGDSQLRQHQLEPEEDVGGEPKVNETEPTTWNYNKGELDKRLLVHYPTTTTPSVPFVSAGWSDSVIAFTARLSSGLHHYGRDETIVFDTVITNNEYAYSESTGKFEAPVDGTYFFMVTIMCDSGAFFEAELVSDGVELIYIYAADDSRHEQGTGGVVLQLVRGDRVWVRHHATEGSTLHSWSSFSGFKISNN